MSELQTVEDAVVQSAVDAASALADNAALAADPQAAKDECAQSATNKDFVYSLMTPAQVGKVSELQTVNNAVVQSEVDAASAPADNAALAADPQAAKDESAQSALAQTCSGREALP